MKRRLRGLATVVLAAVACGRSGDDPDERVCLGGETRLCTGASGCAGAEACRPDGQGYGACECGTTVPTDAAPDAGEGRARFDELGAKCDADDDCGPSLICWAASAREFHGRAGGAAGGYCTAPCQTLAECSAFDPMAGCVAGLCMLGCYSGEPQAGEGKCRDRADLACWSSAALGLTPFDASVRQSGVCLPACGSDEECSGRTCDLALGSCVDTATPGAPIGAACDSGADCAGGVCQSSAAGPFFCSAFCSFGGLGCGYGSNAAPRDAMCLATAVVDDSGAEGFGDLGLCLELCDVPADCSQPGWQCILATGIRGRAGFCSAPAGSAGDIDAGSDGGMP